MKKITVEFDIDEKQEAALAELLPFWQQYVSEWDGDRPFKDYTIEDVFRVLMDAGSAHVIWNRIKNQQYKQGMINMDELIDHENLTIAEREERRQQAQKEGVCE